MPGAQFLEVWPGRCEWKGMSNAETTLELIQRPGFIIQLLARQNLWSLTEIERENVPRKKRDFKHFKGFLMVWKNKIKSNLDPMRGICNSMSNLPMVVLVSLQVKPEMVSSFTCQFQSFFNSGEADAWECAPFTRESHLTRTWKEAHTFQVLRGATVVL